MKENNIAISYSLNIDSFLPGKTKTLKLHLKSITLKVLQQIHINGVVCLLSNYHSILLGTNQLRLPKASLSFATAKILLLSENQAAVVSQTQNDISKLPIFIKVS